MTSQLGPERKIEAAAGNITHPHEGEPVANTTSGQVSVRTDSKVDSQSEDQRATNAPALLISALLSGVLHPSRYSGWPGNETTLW